MSASLGASALVGIHRGDGFRLIGCCLGGDRVTRVDRLLRICRRLTVLGRNVCVRRGRLAIDLLGGREQLGLQFGERLVGVDAGFLRGLLGRRRVGRPLGMRGLACCDRMRICRIERPRQLLERLGQQLG